MLFSPIHCTAKECLLGLQEWTPGNKRRNAFVERQLSPEEDENIDVKTLIDAYHNYKKEYVKSLSFSPKEKGLSKSNFVASLNCFQLPPWIMPHWRQCTSTLTRQPMMRLRGMKR